MKKNCFEKSKKDVRRKTNFKAPNINHFSVALCSIILVYKAICKACNCTLQFEN